MFNHMEEDHRSYRRNFLQLQKERLKKHSGLYRIRTLLPVGLLAQLVELYTGITEVKGSNPVQA